MMNNIIFQVKLSINHINSTDCILILFLNLRAAVFRLAIFIFVVVNLH